ncbi:MAG TPA: TonB-dependent receptor [Candidatus Solibacter sp.]|nr:TonB-dependent receptor [Candidatus Solibacter sp.]
MTRLLLSLVVWALPCAAQFSSAIQGTITDSSNAAVPGARVTLKNVDTGIVREAVTNTDGVYRISSLGPGTYTLSVEKSGFASAERSSVVLDVSQTAKLDVSLSVGAVSEHVDVAATIGLLETEQGRVSGHINETHIKELPINGRNVLNLIAIQPGIVGRGLSAGLYSGGGSDSFSGETQPSVFANGQRFEGNNYTLDDTNTNGEARNGVTNIVPNSEAVEEVRITANNFSAVDGRNPGAQIQMLTKAGTNQFHGVAAYYFVNDRLASRGIFDPAQLPSIRKHLYDGAIGGPIIKNRTFFFFTYEGLRQGGARTASATVETPQFRNYILQTRPNSIAATLLKNFAPVGDPTTGFRDLGTPQPGVNKFSSTPDGIVDVGTVFYTPAAFRNAQQFSIRLDHELRPGKDRVYGSYFRTVNNTLSGGVRPIFDAPQKETTFYGNLNETHTFNPTMMNELRVGVTQLVGRPEVRKHLEVPGINITGSSGFSGALYPSGWWQTNYHYKDVFTWVKGSHNIKIGGEVRHMRGSAQNTSNFIPTYSFASLLDFADDEALSMNRLVSPVSGTPATLFSQLRVTEFAVFVQDDWKVSRNLTLNLGLRYENMGSYWDKDGTARNFLLGSGNTYQDKLATGKVDFVNSFYPRDWNNFGPRIGFAWDPTGKAKMTVRGGFGISNNRLATLPIENYRGNPPLLAQTTLGSQFGTTFTYSLGDPSKPFAGYPVDPALKLGLDEHNGIKGARVGLTAVDPRLRTPYVYNWFFGVQREVSKIVVEANYIGSAGHHLFNSVNLNRYAGDLLDGIFNGFNQSFSNISMIQSTSNSIYHGATLSVKRSLGSGLMLQGSYTYGKAIDDTDGETGTTSWQNAWNRRAERGLAGFDVRHRLNLVGVWNMPFFKQKGSMPVAHWLLGGWQLSGLAIFDNGTPLTVTNGAAFRFDSTGKLNVGGDFNADNTGGDRPNAPTTQIQTSGWSKQQFLNGIMPASAFGTPAPGQDGNLGRTTYRGPGFAQTDLSLAKGFSLTERLRMNFRADAFNAFNRVNLSNPSMDLSSTNFGKSTGTNTARLFQLGLRLSF